MIDTQIDKLLAQKDPCRNCGKGPTKRCTVCGGYYCEPHLNNRKGTLDEAFIACDACAMRKHEQAFTESMQRAIQNTFLMGFTRLYVQTVQGSVNVYTMPEIAPADINDIGEAPDEYTAAIAQEHHDLLRRTLDNLFGLGFVRVFFEGEQMVCFTRNDTAAFVVVEEADAEHIRELAGVVKYEQ